MIMMTMTCDDLTAMSTLSKRGERRCSLRPQPLVKTGRETALNGRSEGSIVCGFITCDGETER